ncbi:MAG: amidohydrolase, partial [Deltaproteobacteria bacterium]|nr:amidohydrolase [Deltaproteobacteria bacterium]
MNTDHEKPDILITGGTLLTMAPPGLILDNQVIGIRDGKILFVQPGPPSLSSSITARKVVDASGCIVMPGLVNVHSHLAMTCFRGMADDLPLMTWLNDHIFPAEAKFIDRKTVYAGAMLAIAEMILSGTTTFCDGYFFEGEVGRAAIATGMRGVIAQGFIDLPTPDRPGLSEHAAIAERFVERWRDRSPLVTPALVCHSAYTCLPETLQTVKAMARRTGVSFQIHLAETREEVRLIRERFLAAGKVKVAHDPESNMKLGAGVAPVPEMLRRGIDVGLGTDGCASNNDLDLFGEMAMAAKLHKVFSGDPTVLPAEKVVEMATIGGARVLGMADRIGSITPGKEADIILVDIQ